jgi:translation initiation factor IF-2
LRDNEVLFEGKVETMKIEQEHVSTALPNNEVGLAFNDHKVRFKPDDIIEVYEETRKTQEIEWLPPGF